MFFNLRTRATSDVDPLNRNTPSQLEAERERERQRERERDRDRERERRRDRQRQRQRESVCETLMYIKPAAILNRRQYLVAPACSSASHSSTRHQGSFSRSANARSPYDATDDAVDECWCDVGVVEDAMASASRVSMLWPNIASE